MPESNTYTVSRYTQILNLWKRLKSYPLLWWLIKNLEWFLKNKSMHNIKKQKSMSRKISVIVLKVITTLVLIYSAFMILFTSIFDLLSFSVNINFEVFLLERIFPNVSAVIALIFLIRYIWTSKKKKSDYWKWINIKIMVRSH